jgi:hypothetical protein
MFDKDFKIALQNLPSTEKDKLILRLLKKDLVLANRLFFELVDTETVEDKRVALQKEISKDLKRSNDRFYSLGYILMDMRNLSGLITEHVVKTKDKYGEITLSIQLLSESISLNKLYILNSKPKDSYTICIYIIARAFKILLLIKAQHEDLHIEFRDSVMQLGKNIGKNDVLMRHAINNGLDVNWLLQLEIPEDIVAIHKEIRANGFLK